MSIAKVENPDKIICTLTFKMSLVDWKQVKETLNTNRRYTELQVINEITDLVDQLEKTYYSDLGKDRD